MKSSALELPGSVELKVTETQPAVKGGTVAGGGKPATLETGLVVTVPDFVKDGETIIVTTDTGTYKGRAQNNFQSKLTTVNNLCGFCYPKTCLLPHHYVTFWDIIHSLS